MPGSSTIARIFPRVLAIALSSLALGACTAGLDREDGGRTYVILGFGVITVNLPDATNMATVVDSWTVGFQYASEPAPSLGLGYLRATTYYVPSNYGYVSDVVASRPAAQQTARADSLGLDYLRATSHEASLAFGYSDGQTPGQARQILAESAAPVRLDGQLVRGGIEALGD